MPPKAEVFLTTVRFVWVEGQLFKKSYRGALNSHRYSDYMTFFGAAAQQVGFPHHPNHWKRFQLIIDSGWGISKLVYDRDNPGPVNIPDHAATTVTFLDRTMSVPVQLRLGGEWKPVSDEIWSIPVDVEMTVRELKEYLLTGHFGISAESLLARMRREKEAFFTEERFQEALGQNSELSTFYLSYQYEGEPVQYPLSKSYVVNLFGLDPPTHMAPRIIFGVIPVSLWD
jgi:hypothetical protein